MKKPAKDRKQRLVAQFRRSEIVASAMTLFGSRGFAGTRMDDIARQANLAKGTLYLYFGSKQDIYKAAVQQAISDLQSLTRERVERSIGIRAQLEAFISVRVAFWEEKRDLYRIIYSMNRDVCQRRQNIVWRRETIQYLSAILTSAVERKEIPPQNIEASAWAIFDIVRGANERRLLGEVRASPKDAHFLTAFALSALAHKNQLIEFRDQDEGNVNLLAGRWRH